MLPLFFIAEFEKLVDKTKEEMIQRKNQLDGYLMNGRTFDDRLCEVESWLNRAQLKLQRLPPVSQSFDNNIDVQLKEQKVNNHIFTTTFIDLFVVSEKFQTIFINDFV